MDLIQTLSFTDTAIGFGIGAVSMLGILGRSKVSHPNKITETLQAYQAKYAALDKPLSEAQNKYLAASHDFMTYWPKLDIEDKIMPLSYLDSLISHRDTMLEYLNELDKTHVSKKRLREIRKDLQKLSSAMSSEMESTLYHAEAASDSVLRAVNNVKKAQSDYAELNSLFVRLMDLMEKLKNSYDPVYISDIGPAYMKAQQAMDMYEMLLVSPEWKWANMNPRFAKWGGVPHTAKQLVNDFHLVIENTVNFPARVFSGTKVLRDTIEKFAKSDPMLYDKVMNIIVKAENHTYVSRNPQQEFEKNIAPAIRILEPKN